MPVFNNSYEIILPFSIGDFYSEWNECLERMKYLEKGGRNRIVKMNIFLDSVDVEDFIRKKSIIASDLVSTFGDSCPSFGILPNKPEKTNIAIEVTLVNPADIELYYRKYNGYNYTVIEKSGCRKIFANGLAGPDHVSDTGDAARNAFEIAYRILLTENMTFNHIIRQWNYIGNILSTHADNNTIIQRYQAFNEVRHDYYSRYRSVQGYPAATGIGMNYDGMMIDFVAMTPCEGVEIASIFNPNQLNPYAYEQKVLVGDSPIRSGKKNPPMFDRGKLIFDRENAVLFVSGTASVFGQETIGSGDVRKQVKVTISNIKALIEPENLIRNCKQFDASDSLKYKRIRVYVKNQSDFELIRSECMDYFGDIPALYLQADICRDDLLVEIEAVLQS